MTRFALPFLLAALSAFPAVLPLEFESNQGQAKPGVRFLARKPSGSILLTDGGMTVHSVGGLSVAMKLVNGSAAPLVTGEQPLAGVSNYFHGSDRRNWHTGIRHFGQVRYSAVYPGVDLLFHGHGDSLEYDFVVGPGADPSAILLSFEGTSGLRIAEDGSLVISSSTGEMRQHPPQLYQELPAGQRHSIPGRYRLLSGTRVGFDVGPWDRSRPLVIDPVLVYTAYLGVSGSAAVNAVGADAAGNSYIAGSIASPDLPLMGALKEGKSGVGFYRSADKAVSFGSANTDLGTLRVDSLAVDSKNAGVVFAGTSHGVFRSGDSGATWTRASDLPLDEFNAVAIDPSNSSIVYAAGSGLYKSTDGGASWSKTVNRLGNTSIAISAQNPNLLYLGNSQGAILRSSDGGDSLVFLLSGYVCYSVAVSPTDGNVMFAAIKDRGVFRTTNGGNSFTPYCVTGNCADPVTGYSVAIDPKSTATVYLGTAAGLYRSKDNGATWALIGTTSGKRVLSIAVDPNSSSLVYLGTGSGIMKSTDGGLTFTTAGFGGYDSTAVAVDPKSQYLYTGLSSNPDAFISKVAPDGKSLLYSTYFGGSGTDTATALAVDASGSVAFCGTTDSSDLPTRNPIQKNLAGGTDIYIARLNANGDALVFSTYLGGKANDVCFALQQDSKGALYVLGQTTLPSSTPGLNTYPIVKGAYQATSLSSQDCVVSKIDANGTALAYSTYLGGNDGEVCIGSAVDISGNLWITGSTFSGNFPNTGANFGTARPSPTYFPNGTGFLTKLNATGSNVTVSGFIGAFDGRVQGQSVALGPTGRIYVGGILSSGDFPVTSGALSTDSGVGAFLIALEPDAVSQVYGAIIPGVNTLLGLQVDSQGNVWAAANISSAGTFTPTWDAFDSLSRTGLTAAGLMEIDPAGSKILYATNLGGLAAESRAVATTSLGPDGTLYVAGYASSTDFQSAAQGFQSTTTPDFALFVEKIDTRTPAPPVVTGVATADGLGTGPFAQGTLILIRGTALASGDTAVTIAGLSAPVVDLTAGLVVRIPEDAAAGDTTLVVTTAAGSSAPIPLTIVPAVP